MNACTSLCEMNEWSFKEFESSHACLLLNPADKRKHISHQAIPMLAETESLGRDQVLVED